MRSPAFIRRSRSLLKAPTTRTSIVHNPVIRLARVARKDGTPPARVYKRLASSTLTPNPSDNTSDPSSAGSVPPPADPSPPEEPEKPTRRTRVSPTTSSTASPSSQPDEAFRLPDDLNIIWLPDEAQSETDFLNNDALPPPELFEEALTNLHIALHPQTQHRAAYVSSSGPPLEPTLALYCPIEGGDYVIDATVKELAHRTGSEVLVIDAVQLAAGECGHFGKAASAVQLPRNPLHFHPPAASAARLPSRSVIMDEDEDMDMMPMAIPSQMTLHLLATPSTRGRTSILAASRSSPTPNRIKTFFDDLVNIPSPNDTNSASNNTTRRPRIIYIRDFPTLASTSATWYPHLLSAVRQRRIGAISRPSSPVSSPMTIIFGVTPPIAPTSAASASASPAGPSQHGLVSFTARRKSPHSAAATPHRSSVADWGEDDIAERAREKRLKERLRRWEKGGDPALLEDLPTLSARPDEPEGENGHRGVVIVGGSPVPPMLESLIAQRMANAGGAPEGEVATPFFRASVLVPGVRLQAEERLCRTSRRREINELAMRMGVGAVGGVLERAETGEVRGEEEHQEGSQEDIWDDWSNRLEAWASVRQIADRAVGSVVSSPGLSQKKPGLEPTPVPWAAVRHAWSAQRSSRDLRKTLMRESVVKIVKQKDAEEDHEDAEGEEAEAEEKVDEVVERVRQDPDLEQHEQRLLSCIVDPGSLSTTFSQVHLPEHTIDSVRTIVSLPLLHPAAFQQGILKEHGMTGCLLFGPPGTGKTLVVRALAKEAGCRMMIISPSDVMDMYVGEGEKLVKAVFSLARRLSPCVVFLDEMDALFGARISGRESGGAFAHRGVITEFMQEMDGLKSSKEDRVIVIGATNRPFDLDDAVLRRVPRRLLVDLPGEKEREEILKILLRDEKLAPEIDLKGLAKKTESFSGSDLKHLCVSAALDAVKEIVEVPWKPDIRTSTSASELVTPPEVASLDTASVSQTLAAEITQADAQELSPEEPVIDTPPHVRVIHLRHFTKALKEITPSSSESLGSLADLRKWNEEFGEGRKDKKRHQVWGKGTFGFIDKTFPIPEDGRVTNRAPHPSQSSIEQ